MSLWKDWKYCSCLGPCLVPCFKSCTAIFANDDDQHDSVFMDFSRCNLKEVPNEVFAAERTLEELLLDSNSIRDLPRVLFHCTGLRKLSISDNELETLPTAISSLVYLKHLDISRNSLLIIPESVKCCKCLTFLDCSVNPLKKLPDTLTQLVNLRELYLNETLLDFLPANFGRLFRLKIVELRDNNLVNLPKSIVRLVQLERLDIGQNNFVEFPDVITSLSSLCEIWCDGNKISSIPESIGNLEKLSYLDASNNLISQISFSIGNCTLLTDLILSMNKITQLPSTIGNLKNLTYLRLDENDLTSLPHSIGELNSLQELVLNKNYLENLPETIGFLRNLNTLIADCNQLRDLPNTICSCSKLRLLSLSSNYLTSLPDDFGRLGNLKVLNLRNNLLSSLPLSFANLTKLQTLWLSDNQQKPSMRLTSEIDEITGNKALTCFLLPQQSPSSNFNDSFTSDHELESGEERSSNQSNKIKFSTQEVGECDFDEAERERNRKLVRNPTPYPKELKVHARHARNLALRKRDSLTSGEDSQGDEMVQAKTALPDNHEKTSQSEIKDAKLTKALKDPESSPSELNSASSCKVKDSLANDLSSPSFNFKLPNESQQNPSVFPSTTLDVTHGQTGLSHSHFSKPLSSSPSMVRSVPSNSIDHKFPGDQESVASELLEALESVNVEYSGENSHRETERLANSFKSKALSTNSNSRLEYLNQQEFPSQTIYLSLDHNLAKSQNIPPKYPYAVNESCQNIEDNSCFHQYSPHLELTKSRISEVSPSPSPSPSHLNPLYPQTFSLHNNDPRAHSRSLQRENSSPGELGNYPTQPKLRYQTAPAQVIFHQFSMGIDPSRRPTVEQEGIDTQSIDVAIYKRSPLRSQNLDERSITSKPNDQNLALHSSKLSGQEDPDNCSEPSVTS